MYCRINFKSKKELKEAVKLGKQVAIYAPGLGMPNSDGVEYLEGPHFPAPHKWWAKVEMKGGLVVKVLG